MTPRQIIRWEEPRPALSGPAPGAHRTTNAVWADVVADLRARPGEWALVLEGTQYQATAAAYHIRTGHYGFTPAGAFSAATRVLRPFRAKDNDKVAVYARANVCEDGYDEGEGDMVFACRLLLGHAGGHDDAPPGGD